MSDPVGNAELSTLKRREHKWHQLAEHNRAAARDHYSQGNNHIANWHQTEAEKCDYLADQTRQQINQITNSPTHQTNRILDTMITGEHIGVVAWDPHDLNWKETHT